MAEDPCGIIVVDKEKGMTSHDVVDLVRKTFAIKKVGHAGTLDPGATGVLVLLLGKATKLSERYLSEEKEYKAVLKLGERTGTGDADGVILNKREVLPSTEEITRVVLGFEGESEQIPPMVSAKKVGGKKLYELARKGISVERRPVKINIRKITVEKIDIPYVSVLVACTKGTYIRQLADDIGEKLGCGAHLTELRRTRSGAFTENDAVSLSALRSMDRKVFDESVQRV